MLVTTYLDRVFMFHHNGQNLVLTDPDNNLSPEAVLNFYANTYPELTTAKIAGGEINNDRLEYQFESVMGTKG